MLFYKSIAGHVTRQYLDDFYEVTKTYNIDWTKCTAVCNDGENAITGKTSGFVKKS